MLSIYNLATYKVTLAYMYISKFCQHFESYDLYIYELDMKFSLCLHCYVKNIFGYVIIIYQTQGDTKRYIVCTKVHTFHNFFQNQLCEFTLCIVHCACII